MWNCCRRFWYSKVPEITSEFQEFIIDDKEVWVETIEYNTIDIYEKKYRIHDKYKRTTYEEAYNVIHELPSKSWIWIGDKDKDMTDEIQPFVVNGNKITLKLLKFFFPYIKRWTYYSMTLDLIDFPSEGIIINDSNKKAIKKED
jgi:hypothetical protein